ncbi:MAG: acyl-ACP--UDP-N-acetylglucosamine O-acyltransferase [Methylococcales bacterium]
MIESTAIIDRSAQLADDVSIGAYSIVGPNVIIDTGTTIGPHAVINGPTRIGKNNRVYQFTSIGEDPQDKKYGNEVTELVIGDNNVIREFSTMHRGTSQDKGVTKIGSHNLFMAYSHVAHDCLIGNYSILANGASLAGHVRVDDHVILGGFTLVHQFCKVGTYAFSAMGSALSQDVPPYLIVSGRPTTPRGINAVGLERSGFSPELIRIIRNAYKVVYKSGLTLEEALIQLQDVAEETPEVKCFIDFIKGCERGILR